MGTRDFFCILVVPALCRYLALSKSYNYLELGPSPNALYYSWQSRRPVVTVIAAARVASRRQLRRGSYRRLQSAEPRRRDASGSVPAAKATDAAGSMWRRRRRRGGGGGVGEGEKGGGVAPLAVRHDIANRW